MADIEVSEERTVAAPPAVVYEVIADYQNHHPRILPPAFFDLKVLEGGRGDGTVITFKGKLGGVTRESRAEVREPEPGRVLTESDPSRGLVTTFTVEPGGEGTRLRIETHWPPRGLQGFIERLMAPGMLRGVYKTEIDNIERYAKELAQRGKPPA